MTKEEKDLLLKDLCARLPYGAVLKVRLIDNYDDMVERNIKLTQLNIGYAMSDSHWLDFKVYLRSMSSMTEEERTEIDKLNRPPGGDWVVQLSRGNTGLYNNFSRVVLFKSINKVLDYLNSHHFDYRGLIEKGLALEAPNEIYNN